MDIRPSSDEALFYTLIAASDVPFSAAFKSSFPRPGFYPDFDQSLAATGYRKGVDLETDGSPMIFLKFWRTRGKSASF